ncbi:MAG: gamma-glutamylcyclotransferase [Cyclobacteriaceae bacterium]|jgi:gamma-glutamylcyclotransferase (GGCT)/AIG2-like uncharacterized protein YtfP|nr:gamma-glutamylcyclotransferase [Cyclobacteriaceae bacterium]
MSTQYIFFYGTLMCPEVYSAVAGQSLVSEPAVLKGYQIYSLKDRVYPGIKTDLNAEVTGVISKVDSNTLDKLDWFEGSEYERKYVKLRVDVKNQFEAWVYVLKETNHYLIDNEGWSYESFLKNNIKYY